MLHSSGVTCKLANRNMSLSGHPRDVQAQVDSRLDCLMQRLLNHIKPDQVHVMESGKIIFSGDIRVADILEAEGYEGIRKAIQQQGSNGASQELKPAMSGNPD